MLLIHGRKNEYNPMLEAAVRRRLTSIGVHYVRSTEVPDAALRSILSDKTNDVILMGHGIVQQHGGPAYDFLIRPPNPNGTLDRLISGGYTIQAKTVSLIGCQTSTVPLQANGVVTTTDIHSNQSLLVAQTIAIRLIWQKPAR
jgi:hypothetical protein